MKSATLVAEIDRPLSPSGVELVDAAGRAEMLEVRAERVGELDCDWIRNRFPGRLLYSRRGRDAGSDARARGELLCRAARAYDLVELDASRDLVPEVLSRIAPERRVIAWHAGDAEDPEVSGSNGPGIDERLEQMVQVPARWYRLVTRSTEATDELVPLELLASLRRTDVVAYAEGKGGGCSRLLAPRLGAPMVFAPLGPADDDATSSLTLERLIGDFGLPALPPLRTLYGIVGRSVAHSLSPRGHNAGYRALDLPALYVPLRTDRLAELWRRLATSTALERLGVGLGGATIVAPHKEAALELADLATEAASRSGGANLLARAAEGWRADTTDVEGVLAPLEERGVDLGGAPVAVVGCGGAGRAAAFGLARRGAQVTIVNRDIARGRDVAARLGVFHLPLECFSGSEAAGRFAVVVHATPVGRSGDDLPFDLAGRGARARVLVDLVYRSEGSGPTVLVRRARALGWTTIDGREVLRAQIRAQFLGLTGRRYPCELHEILASSPHAHLDPA